MPSRKALAANWRPIDVEGLEPAAEEAVRSASTTLVIAGPGAGKTELLAQRACYLLQTMICPDPARILAISFKRDAARNLAERVERRCGVLGSRRFDSYTFDALSKSLVDHFRAALPPAFQPTENFVIDHELFYDRQLRELIQSVPSSVSNTDRAAMSTDGVRRAFGRTLPVSGTWVNATHEDVIAGDLWRYLLHSRSKSVLSFSMLGQLAEHLLRMNPQVLLAVRATYRYVFLDEFQDTTTIHYRLIHRAFHGSPTVLTAVGDDKQRIMGWAGALNNVFKYFVEHFAAGTIRLTRNYRSAGALVRVQSVVAKALDPTSTEATPFGSDQREPGECRILSFADDAEEAVQVARLVANLVKVDLVPPREICVLCRMKPPIYTQKLQEALRIEGVRSRFENELQDLLAEPLTVAVLDMLKLALQDRAPESWARTLQLLSELGGDSSDESMRVEVDRLVLWCAAFKQRLDVYGKTERDLAQVVNEVIQFLGEAAFKSINQRYQQGTFYRDTSDRLSKALTAALQTNSWSAAVDDVEGVGTVPIMTTHKSKGLEYHTVIFIGLEDSAHFGFAGNRTEETCGFFVALSRAKQRVVFTFSGVRPTGRNGTNAVQGRESIGSLYGLLESAGISVERPGT